MSQDPYLRAIPSYTSRIAVTTVMILLSMVIFHAGFLIIIQLDLSFGLLIPLLLIIMLLFLPFLASRGILDSLECRAGFMSYLQMKNIKPVELQRVELPYKKVSFSLVLRDIMIFRLDRGFPFYTSTIWRAGEQKYTLQIGEDGNLALIKQ